MKNIIGLNQDGYDGPVWVNQLPGREVRSVQRARTGEQDAKDLLQSLTQVLLRIEERSQNTTHMFQNNNWFTVARGCCCQVWQLGIQENPFDDSAVSSVNAIHCL